MNTSKPAFHNLSKIWITRRRYILGSPGSFSEPPVGKMTCLKGSSQGTARHIEKVGAFVFSGGTDGQGVTVGSNLVSTNSAIGIGSGQKELVWLMSKNCLGGICIIIFFWEGPEVTVTPLGDVDVDSFHRWNLRRKSAALVIITFEIRESGGP